MSKLELILQCKLWFVGEYCRNSLAELSTYSLLVWLVGEIDESLHRWSRECIDVVRAIEPFRWRVCLYIRVPDPFAIILVVSESPTLDEEAIMVELDFVTSCKKTKFASGSYS